MLHVVLYQPEIPPNTGNIIRLCAAVGATLHLIEPLGFHFDDKTLRRAGLDYHALTKVLRHPSHAALLAAAPARRMIALTTRGTQSLYAFQFERNDLLAFGAETSGLPAHVRDEIPASHQLRIPMRAACRSLNLANAVAITLYEALRQCDPSSRAPHLAPGAS
ncbi:MAG: tRNA (uridine(34)/cytosine(34)/5-carboxymethylaminomethyluridine(34)-2'-O)-methyltransferase TrmL [Gammaproteobacteria bacterium]|nr:tRNA (uridine(34)/cytosine(34)/5-carboxymethylaminomethyluridine(34)-2'-O)-methyltransferase TrmL [Gammaproteobacteria bacterium]